MNKSNLISDLKTLFKILPRRNRHTLLLNQIGIGISSVVSLISVALVPLFFTLIFPEIASSSNKRLLFLQNEISKLNLGVPQLGIVVISLILISNGILAYFSFLNFRISNLIFRDMSTELFRYFLHKEMAYHLEVNSAFIKSKVQSDCSRVVNQVLIPALNIIPGLVTLGMVVFGLGILNWKLTFIIFSFCLIVFVSFSELFKKKIRQYGHQQTCLSVTYHSTLSEGLNSLKETKILGKENLVIDEFFNVTQLLTSIDAKSSFFQAAPKFIGESAVFVLIIVLGCFAAVVDPNLFSISELAMFGIGSLKALPSINVIFSNLAKMNSGLSAIDHIKADLISAKHENPFKFKGIPVGTIKLSQVNFSYPKTSELIFRDLNLSIKPGDKIALVGPSGSGKSTLIDLILGLLPPTSGAVEFDSTSKDLYRVSYVPQKIFLMDKSIEENIYFGRSELMNEQALQDCLIASRAIDFVSRSDKGVKTLVGEDGCRLSGGERQRVGIARALINKPSLLIVDEGTSAMDPNLEAEVLKNIWSKSNGLTLIWVTHRYQNLGLFDRVYRVENLSLVLTKPSGLIDGRRE